MKLRIKGNSIRIRLSQKEVQEIEDGRTVSEQTSFSVLENFTYSLVPWEMNLIEAKFENESLTVFIPKEKVEGWLQSSEVGFETEQQNGTAKPLRILIEKDFACLAPRVDEDESGNFPNPELGAKC